MNHRPANDVRGSWLVTWLKHPAIWLVAIALILLGTAFAGYRAHKRYAVPDGQFDFSRSGMSDFHNGAYYPSLAFRQGINPYSKSVTEHFPMARSAPPYSPVVFLIYQPFTWLDLPAADIAFFAFNVILLAATSWFIVSMIRNGLDSASKEQGGPSLLQQVNRDGLIAALLTGILLLSRPGHITLFTGYFTIQLVLGTLIALHFDKTRPWLSGVGMLLASGKPTYIIPLVILMAARKRWTALIIGLTLCAVVAAGGLMWLASHSDFSSVVNGIAEGQAEFDNDPTEDPKNTWTRLDTMGVIAKVAGLKPSGMQYLLGMFVILAIPCWLIAGRVETEPVAGGAGLTASIAMLSLLISIYHHSYDGLVAASVWAAVVLGGQQLFPGLTTWKLRSLAVLLTVPMINYFATLRFREWAGFENQDLAWHLITSANGVCLLLALLVMMSARRQ